MRDKLKEIPEFKSNKDERTIIIEILACIGILNPMSYDRATSSKNDWTFVEYWRGEDGYDTEVVEKILGNICNLIPIYRVDSKGSFEYIV